MSRTKHGKKPVGYDFWGSRGDLCAPGYGPYVKLLTHRKERCQNNTIVRKELKIFHKGDS